MKDKYIKAYIDMAERFGKTSEAERLKVGCLIVKPNGGVIAEGCNGQPPGWPTEVCEEPEYNTTDYFDPIVYPHFDEDGCDYRMVTSPTVRHAEIAALEKLWSSPNSSEGCYMFLSHSPCPACCIKIVTAKISKVYYKTPFRDTSGIDYLITHGIMVEQIN